MGIFKVLGYGGGWIVQFIFISSLLFPLDNLKVHIKKFPHSEEFLQERFLPFEEDWPEYKAYLFTYKSDKYKSLLVPAALEVYFDNESVQSYEKIEIQAEFTKTGNDGFQYQSKDSSKNNFHFGITKTSSHNPFFDYHIVIRFNNQNWTYKAEASDFSRYLVDDNGKLEEMHNIFAQDAFVLTSANDLLAKLFSEKDSFVNFNQLINLFSVILGPRILDFYPIDERNFYVQSEYTYLICDNCYITCYDKEEPIKVINSIVFSSSDCKIMRPPDGEPPQYGVPALSYMIQNYPAKQVLPPPTESSIPLPEPDDAWHTSLWLPCQGNVNLKYEQNSSKVSGSKGDFSTYCTDTNPGDDVQGYFYRVTEDYRGEIPYCNSDPTKPFNCKHEMFEVTNDGIYIRREILPDYKCQGIRFDYRHHNKFKWFPKYVYPPMLYVIWFNEECWETGGFSNVDACTGLSYSNQNVPHLTNYSEPENPDSNCNGNVISIYEFARSIPDPDNSRDPSYCTKVSNYESTQGQSAQCPSGQIKLANPNDLIEITCYSGPKIPVKGIMQTFHLCGGGKNNTNCGKEKYYYAKDGNDPTITWGYVYYEYIPPDSSCTNPTNEPCKCNSYIGCGVNNNWDCYKNEYFSTKYYPDLKPYIPNSAIEKH